MTDELDRRVLNSYLNQYYCEDALSISNYALSPLPVYFVPETRPLQSYKDYLQTLPSMTARKPSGSTRTLRFRTSSRRRPSFCPLS